MVGLLRAEELFQITHNLGIRYKSNRIRSRWFSGGCLTDEIDSSDSILYFLPLNKITFEISASLLPWVQTCIGFKNIETLTP